MSTKKTIYPIILSGGSGTRLWPLSRLNMPKQFIKLLDEISLFQQTVDRLNHINFADPIIVSSENSRFIVKNQLSKIRSNNSGIIIEPSSKDTAPAALSGILHANSLSKDPIVLICPADHWINDKLYFQNIITNSIQHITKDDIITFGIRPRFPHTGYGWITCDSTFSSNEKKLYKVINFIEKPALVKAETLIKESFNFWNSGIFLGRASTFINAYRESSDLIYELVKKSYDIAETDLDFLRLNEEKWDKIDKISIDYAIIEKFKNIHMVPFEGKWSDVGSLKSLMQHYKKDKNKNVAIGNSTIIDCHNTFLSSSDDQIHLLGMGLNNVISVATKDAVLCIDQAKSENVKDAVNLLIEKNIEQVEKSLNDYRPWGNFEVLSKGNNYKVKKINVYSNCRLSLQSHKHRSEHWVVVEGKATVTLGDKIITLLKNESIFINSGIKHRLENKTKKTITIIEVQTGNYLGEDDIIRYEDDYKRIN